MLGLYLAVPKAVEEVVILLVIYRFLDEDSSCYEIELCFVRWIACINCVEEIDDIPRRNFDSIFF